MVKLTWQNVAMLLAGIASAITAWSYYQMRTREKWEREIALDTAIARSMRIPALEWRVRRQSATDSVYRDRHPEFFDTAHTTR